MTDVIYARKDGDGNYIFHISRDAWEFHDRETGATWWVTDRAMQGCIRDRTEAFIAEGHAVEDASELAYEMCHDDAWGKDEWASIHGVYCEAEETEEAQQ